VLYGSCGRCRRMCVCVMCDIVAFVFFLKLNHYMCTLFSFP
jgi:hypothetical protein